MAFCALEAVLGLQGIVVKWTSAIFSTTVDYDDDNNDYYYRYCYRYRYCYCYGLDKHHSSFVHQAIGNQFFRSLNNLRVNSFKKQYKQYL